MFKDKEMSDQGDTAIQGVAAKLSTPSGPAITGLSTRRCFEREGVSILRALKTRTPADGEGHRLSVPGELSGRMFGFDNERIVSEVNAEVGDVEWFFRAREGLIGPYPSRNFAGTMLLRFKARCQNRKVAGGR
jgi:hypothetical protein